MQLNKTFILMLVLLLVVISIFYILVIQPEEFQQTSSEHPQQSPVSAAIQQTCNDYCFIQEVHPDFIQNETIVHLTDNDLKGFPEYEKGIKSSVNSPLDWYNGRRGVYDFIDSQCQFSQFCNLSCKGSSDPQCDPRESPVVYEYDGRYYAVGCFPDFGGAHEGRE